MRPISHSVCIPIEIFFCLISLPPFATFCSIFSVFRIKFANHNMEMNSTLGKIKPTQEMNTNTLISLEEPRHIYTCFKTGF